MLIFTKSLLFNIFLQCLIILFAMQTFYYHFPYELYDSPFPTATLLFKEHPFAMSIGFIICHSESIWLSHLSNRLSRRRWILYYGLNLIGIGFATWGLSSILSVKYIDLKSHFTSWHGTIGITTYAHSILQFLAGLMLLIPKNKFSYFLLTKKTFKNMHRISGCVLVLEIFVVSVLSCYTTWFQFVSKYDYVFFVNIGFYTVVAFSSLRFILQKNRMQYRII